MSVVRRAMRLTPRKMLISFLLISWGSQAETSDQCLQRLVLTSPVSTTVGELKMQCQKSTASLEDPIDTVVEERIASERAVATNQFSLVQHLDNYLLPFSYNYKSEEIEASSIPGNARTLDPTEFKFQLSFKTPLWNRPFGTSSALYAAYTNMSWWQAYNSDESSPFRETNHQPELFLDMPSGFTLGTWELANTRLGISHQSNGRSGEFSRTWNRIFAEFVFSNESNEIRFKPWKSISNISDNPDIEEFRGRFELAGKHHLSEHTLAWKLRHTLDSNNRGSIELDWSHPIYGRNDLQLFVQYFDGYGESLIDYNLESRRIGLGFKLGQ